MKRFLLIFSFLTLTFNSFTQKQKIITDIDFFTWNKDIQHDRHIRYIYGGDLLIIRHFVEGKL